MGLSNETTPNLKTTNDFVYTLAEMRATRLASQLIQRERNPVPMEPLDAARAVRIRRQQDLMQFGPRPRVPDDVSSHNQAVCDLRRPS